MIHFYYLKSWVMMVGYESSGFFSQLFIDFGQHRA